MCRMLVAALVLTGVFLSQSLSAQTTPASQNNVANKAAPVVTGPKDPKAKQTYDEAKKLSRERNYLFALDKFRKADKQDGGQCLPCEVEAYKAARQAQDYKAAREQTTLMLEHVTTPIEKAQVHALAGQACLAEGAGNNHEKAFQAADSEFQAALQLAPNKIDCLYSGGVALAHLKQDGAARERFKQFLTIAAPSDLDYIRGQKFADNPELARARMVPNFRFTSSDGHTISLDSLAGKVVLVDFWATWCGPCREALPNVKKIAQKFAGQPFVVVSVSLDNDDSKWRDFIARNGMTWTQARDGGSDGSVAHLFGVTAIPATFTIDADGVLQDQHVGDAEIETKIKKLIAHASELSNRKSLAEAR